MNRCPYRFIPGAACNRFGADDITSIDMTIDVMAPEHVEHVEHVEEDEELMYLRQMHEQVMGTKRGRSVYRGKSND